MRTLMIWVGGTSTASARSLTVAPGSTLTALFSSGFASASPDTGRGFLGCASVTVGRGPLFVALASITTRRRLRPPVLSASVYRRSRGGSATVLSEDPFVDGIFDHGKVVIDLDARLSEALHDFLRFQR